MWKVIKLSKHDYKSCKMNKVNVVNDLGIIHLQNRYPKSLTFNSCLHVFYKQKAVKNGAIFIVSLPSEEINNVAKEQIKTVKRIPETGRF